MLQPLLTSKLTGLSIPWRDSPAPRPSPSWKCRKAPTTTTTGARPTERAAQEI